MKVWRVQRWDNDAGQMYEWFATQREAKRRRGEVLAEYKSLRDEGRIYNIPEVNVEQVDIPTTKKDLVIWLNSSLATDNG